MSHLSYAAATVRPVRGDFAAAHNRFWKRLAAPRAWWSGAERVAIAAEVRWVPMILAERATRAEADLYGDKPTGNVIRAMSLVPDEVHTLQDLSTVHYLPAGQVRNPTASAGTLSRMQMELIAGRVSALQQCFY